MIEFFQLLGRYNKGGNTQVKYSNTVSSHINRLYAGWDFLFMAGYLGGLLDPLPLLLLLLLLLEDELLLLFEEGV